MAVIFLALVLAQHVRLSPELVYTAVVLVKPRVLVHESDKPCGKAGYNNAKTAALVDSRIKEWNSRYGSRIHSGCAWLWLDTFPKVIYDESLGGNAWCRRMHNCPHCTIPHEYACPVQGPPDDPDHSIPLSCPAYNLTAKAFDDSLDSSYLTRGQRAAFNRLVAPCGDDTVTINSTTLHEYLAKFLNFEAKNTSEYYNDLHSMKLLHTHLLLQQVKSTSIFSATRLKDLTAQLQSNIVNLKHDHKVELMQVLEEDTLLAYLHFIGYLPKTITLNETLRESYLAFELSKDSPTNQYYVDVRYNDELLISNMTHAEFTQLVDKAHSFISPNDEICQISSSPAAIFGFLGCSMCYLVLFPALISLALIALCILRKRHPPQGDAFISSELPEI
jgi:hypothetical protein